MKCMKTDGDVRGLRVVTKAYARASALHVPREVAALNGSESVTERETVERVREAVSSRTPEAALDVLELLGWGEGYAQTSPCPGVPAFDRLVLGGYPTRASVAREQRDTPSILDTMAYFAGSRWSLSVLDGELRWCDFSAGQAWGCRAGDLSIEAIRGFTPSSFARIGRFEPRTGERHDTHRREDASEYLLGRVQTWWKRWRRDVASEQSDVGAKSHFVQLLSALLLVKTLEDLDRLHWLRRGTLRETARDGASLPQLLRRCARVLNSRVLRSVAELPDDAVLVRPLVDAIEESEIDFASLDVDPVGAFYEQMLGTSHELVDSLQPTLPTMQFGGELKEDTSARRRLGAYFTPRSYADTLAHQLILPAVRIANTLEELPSVLDPAAGSGELLCAALREMFVDVTWRRPEVARAVLAEKLWAIDRNADAVHIAALNVLRTTVRLVPEMLDDVRPFPSLDRNFITGDAKSQRVLDGVPTVDAVLLNPPFAGHRQWRAPDRDAARALDQLGPVNLAYAFLSIALDKVRDGGAVGAVMASQLFSGVQHRNVRAALAAKLRIETVIVNHGSPFPAALSYAGMLLGHRLPGAQLSRAEVITVPGGIRHGAADFGASLFSARAPDAPSVEAHATTRWLTISSDTLDDWTGTSAPKASRVGRKAPHVPLFAVLRGGIHQGVVAAPRPWGYELFVFDEIPGGVVHRGGKRRLNDQTPTLRSYSRPKLLGGVPNLCEPVVAGSRVFLPGRGDSKGVSLDELRAQDPIGAKLAETIRDAVLDGEPAGRRAAVFSAGLREGTLKYNWSKGYSDGSDAQMILSQASRSARGQSDGVTWSAWLNVDGSVVPLEGIHARAVSVEYAILIVTSLNIGGAVEPLLQGSPIRNEGTKKPLLAALREWSVPDISAGVYQGVIGELVDAFHIYRSVARGLTPDEAHASRAYKELLSLGAELWRL